MMNHALGFVLNNLKKNINKCMGDLGFEPRSYWYLETRLCHWTNVLQLLIQWTTIIIWKNNNMPEIKKNSRQVWTIQPGGDTSSSSSFNPGYLPADLYPQLNSHVQPKINSRPWKLIPRPWSCSSLSPDYIHVHQWLQFCLKKKCPKNTNHEP